MAKAVKIAPPPAPPATYELTLSAEEAEAVVGALDRIGGSSVTRSRTDSVARTLHSAGVGDGDALFTGYLYVAK